jgi:hypothetical protein
MDVIKYLLDQEDFVEGQLLQPLDARSLGLKMADLYECWDGPAGFDLPAITAEFLRRLDQLDSPVGATCLHLAAELERWGGHDYHSARHHAEVATNAMILTEHAVARANPFSNQQRALLLAAGLAHDIYFDPTSSSKDSRFEAERQAAAALETAALLCGVPAPERATLRDLILATEPGFRIQLSALLRGELDIAAEAELCIPANQPMAAMAGVLSDADLLSSVGLTMDWHLKQLHRLERELGRLISPAEDLRFFEAIVGPDFLSSGGRVFSENLNRIRELVRQDSDLVSDGKT